MTRFTRRLVPMMLVAAAALVMGGGQVELACGRPLVAGQYQCCCQAPGGAMCCRPSETSLCLGWPPGCFCVSHNPASTEGVE